MIKFIKSFLFFWLTSFILFGIFMMVILSLDPIGEVIDPTYTLEDEDANYLIIFSISYKSFLL